MSSADLDDAMRGGDERAIGGAFDAIVVGAGVAGGLAADLLSAGGLNVLLLDAGYRLPFWRTPIRSSLAALQRNLADPRMLNVLPPRIVSAGRAALRLTGRIRQPMQAQCFAWERAPDAFIDDREAPYATPPTQPFVWIRSHGLGGRMVVPGHGRQYYRLGREDFAPNDGLSPAWPLLENELDPWYALVERKLGLAGRCDGLPSPPDSEISRVLEPSSTERALGEAIRARWPGATPIVSRYAPPLASVAAAAQTGRLACRVGALAQRVLVDPSGRASGVAWHDRRTRRIEQARAPLVFLCASSLESTRILLNSRTHTEDVLGAPEALGRGLMDHMMVKAEGIGPALDDAAANEDGRCLYLPRFDRRDGAAHTRGFGVQLYWTGAGARSYFTAVAFAEVVPRAENRVTLDPERKDAWGNPTLQITYAFNDAERALAREMSSALEELAALANAKLSRLDRTPAAPGLAVHECGTARMGADAATSVLDPNNQCWSARGLYVTDGACFPSQGAQNPTLTIMALTARACDHALRTRSA
jgi:choline dehydrogenase-like flavoprotein